MHGAEVFRAGVPAQVEFWIPLDGDPAQSETAGERAA
jgi:hypothetical protein